MTRRAMTLMEMLLAVALLAAISVACVPVISASLRALKEPPGEMSMEDLATYADEWAAEFETSMAADPAEGAGAEAREGQAGVRAIQELRRVAETSEGAAVRIECFEGGPDAGRAWVLFRSGECHVLRAVSVKREGVEAQPGAAQNRDATSN